MIFSGMTRQEGFSQNDVTTHTPVTNLHEMQEKLVENESVKVNVKIRQQ